MIRLALRLTLRGGREALARLVVTATAVTLGVGLLLITLAGINAVNSQNARYAWLETDTQTSALAGPSTADPEWWLLTPDEFHGRLIGRVDVAATGPNSPVPPGLTHLPGPGQFYASPSMTTLLRSTPAAELGERYPGTQIGTIGSSALPAPNSLLIVIGRTPAQLEHVSGAERVSAISRVTPNECNGSCYFIGIDASGIDLVLSVVAAAVLLPVLVFIGAATRLSAARREQRFAAMRLVGATPRQVALISAVESTVAAVIGVALGFGLFFALRPSLAQIPFTGAPFFTSDLTPNLADVLLVALGVPVAAAIAARIALRRVSTSPLGVTRHVTPRPPRAWRVIPLVLGIGELAYFVHAGRPTTTPGQIQAFLVGFVLIMAGLVLAGPWLTSLGSRLMARRARRPATLIAGRRLADNPRAAFRAISGLVLALFVASVAIGVITTVTFYGGGSDHSAAARRTVVDQLVEYSDDGSPIPVSSVPGPLLGQVRSVPGVTAVALVHPVPISTGPSGPGFQSGPGPQRGAVPQADAISCGDLAVTPALGRCPPGASAVLLPFDFGNGSFTAHSRAHFAVSISTARLATLPVDAIVVTTDGSQRAIERTRTILEQAYPQLYFPATIAEQDAQNPSTKLTAQYQQLVDVIILTSLPIAGCSLAVSVVAGLSDRKRPFSLLRLSGVPLATLRRVVALESAAPLLVIAVFSTGVGFLAAGLFVRAQLHESLRPPGTAFYVLVAVGLLASLGVIASTLPVLARLTGPETARND